MEPPEEEEDALVSSFAKDDRSKIRPESGGRAFVEDTGGHFTMAMEVGGGGGGAEDAVGAVLVVILIDDDEDESTLALGESCSIIVAPVIVVVVVVVVVVSALLVHPELLPVLVVVS